MKMYRIVHNEQTGAYRVERRGLFGWGFVTDPQSGDYLAFADLDAARSWVRIRQHPGKAGWRRWKVVSDCST